MKQKSLFKITLFIFNFIILTSLNAQSPNPKNTTKTPITYNELLKSASEHSYRLQVLNTDKNIETARKESLTSQYYPSFSLSYNNEYNKDLNEVSRGGESVGAAIISGGTGYKSSLSLNLNYELYHFGVTEKSIQMASSEVKVKDLLWCEEEKRLHQNILETYNKALKMQLQNNKKSEILLLRKELYEIKQRLYKAGQFSKLDLGDDAIKMIDTQREIEYAQMEYEDAVISLNTLSHSSYNSNTITLLPIGYSPIKKVVSEFDETTEAHRYKEQILKKRHEISMLKRSQLPTLSTYGNYYMFGAHDSVVMKSVKGTEPYSWKLGLALRINIFEGFKYNHEIQRLHYELDRLQQERDMQKYEHEHNAKQTTNKLFMLITLQNRDEALYEESNSKVNLVNRLKSARQVNGVDALNAKLERLERSLNLEIDKTEAAYANASLDIQYRGVNQCTQH